MRVLRILIVPLMAVVMTACGSANTPSGSSSAAAPTAVTVRVNSTYYGSHSIFFDAIAKGYYKNANISVAMEQGNGSSTVVQLVANKSDTFGYVDDSALVTAAAQGAPVVSVGVLDAEGSDAVLCRPDMGIKTIKDLDGKTILISAGAAVNIGFPVVAKYAGLDLGSIKLVTVDQTAQLPLVLEKKAPCLLGGADDRPAEFRAQGVNPVVFKYSDYGISRPGYSIVANTATVASDPAMVKAFVAATLKGYQDAIEDPSAAIAAMTSQVKLEIDQKTAVSQLDFTTSVAYSKANTKKCLGYAVPADWNSMLDYLKKYGGLQTTATNADQFYTNQFISCA